MLLIATKWGYFGDGPGIAVVAPAGSIAVFSSIHFHRSGANTTQTARRFYMSQNSSQPILSKEGKELKGFPEPLLKDEKRVSWQRPRCHRPTNSLRNQAERFYRKSRFQSLLSDTA